MKFPIKPTAFNNETENRTIIVLEKNQQKRDPKMNIHIPVSPGELADKLSILEIKNEKITDSEKLKNIGYEQSLLRRIWSKSQFEKKFVSKELSELKMVNRKLWEIEDQIRFKESGKQFDEEFIKLARLVYISNDKRSGIKRKINQIYGSDLLEEKSYSTY